MRYDGLTFKPLLCRQQRCFDLKTLQSVNSIDNYLACIEIEIKKLVYKAGEKQQELYQQENIKNMIED